MMKAADETLELSLLHSPKLDFTISQFTGDYTENNKHNWILGLSITAFHMFTIDSISNLIVLKYLFFSKFFSKTIVNGYKIPFKLYRWLKTKTCGTFININYKFLN